MNIESILFDFDGTIIDSSLRIAEAKRDFLKRLKELGIDPGRISSRKPAELIITYLERYRAVDRGFLRQVLEESFKPYEMEAAEKASLRPGARKVLTKLRLIGYRIALVSNNSRTCINRVMERLDLEDLFDIVVSREDVRRLKPHEEPILKAVDRLKSAPWRSLYVGDSIVDVIAGKRAGTHVVALADIMSSDNPPTENSHHPDYIIERLEDLLEVVRLLEKRDF